MEEDVGADQAEPRSPTTRGLFSVGEFAEERVVAKTRSVAIETGVTGRVGVNEDDGQSTEYKVQSKDSQVVRRERSRGR